MKYLKLTVVILFWITGTITIKLPQYLLNRLHVLVLMPFDYFYRYLYLKIYKGNGQKFEKSPVFGICCFIGWIISGIFNMVDRVFCLLTKMFYKGLSFLLGKALWNRVENQLIKVKKVTI